MKEHTKESLIAPDYSFYPVKGELTVDGVPVSKLVEKYGSPLYIYSGKAIRESYQRLSRALKGLPVQICYAVKANSNIHILKLLSSLGAGCDLVSYGEWHRAELAKVPRARRVLSGVAKTADELDLLMNFDNAGVGSIHVESAMEFELIALMAHIKRKSVTISFRYNPDVDAKTLDKISTGRSKDKFGLTREEILDLCVNYADDEYVRIAGLSIHIGSQITKTGPYEKAFKILSKLCDEVEDHLGRKLDYVDLGGGIGVQYLNEKTIALSEYAALVKKYFSRYPKILIEPGRSLVANAGILVSEVVYSKIRPNNRTLILDAGMNDLMRPALYDAYHGITPVLRTKEIKEKSWDVVGGICETTDYFARARKLAVEGLPGERVAFLSSGAYGFSMSSTYNTRPRVAEILVDQGKVKLIRKRETLADLISHEQI
jgi:diaminopimelate decarboxylase